MAVYNVPITYPDGEQARILAALKSHYGQINDSGTLRDRTNAEALAAFASSCRNALAKLVSKVEDDTATTAAKATVTTVNIS